MLSRTMMKMTVLTVLGLGAFQPAARAQDAAAPPAPAAMAAPACPIYTDPWCQWQAPNPTYWTRLSCPLHGSCNCCCEHGVWTIPAVRWLLDPDYYTVAPDYGWGPPGKRPIARVSPIYRRYYPSQWYGTQKSGQVAIGPQFPVVATPTDTTQLGYYYQTVATWLRDPRMLPPAPHPRDWHHRPCQIGPNGGYVAWVRLPQGARQGMPGAICPVAPVGAVQVPPQPDSVPPANAAPPEPQPEAAPVPAPPAQAPEAINEPEPGNGIQRAGFLQRVFHRK